MFRSWFFRVILFICLLYTGPAGAKPVRSYNIGQTPLPSFFLSGDDLYTLTLKGRIYRLRSGKKPLQTANLNIPAPFRPSVSEKEWIFLTHKGKIRIFNPHSRHTELISIKETGFLCAPVRSNDLLFFIDQEHILHAYDLKQKRSVWTYYTGPALASGLFIVPEGILAVNRSGRMVLLEPETGKLLAENEQKSGIQQAVLCGEGILLRSDNTLFLSRLESKAFLPLTVLSASMPENFIIPDPFILPGPPPEDKKEEKITAFLQGLPFHLSHAETDPILGLTAFQGHVFFNTASGRIQIMNDKPSQSPPSLPIQTENFKDGWEVLFFENRVKIQKSGTPVYTASSLRIHKDDILSAEFRDLNGNGRTDLFLTYTLNKALNYEGIFILINHPAKGFLEQKFTTVRKTNTPVLQDKNNDGTGELILFWETGPDWTFSKDKRLLVPDIYTAGTNGFFWDSISYPEFYQKETKKLQRFAESVSFSIEWQNRLWNIYTDRIIRLEKELVTLNRQIGDLYSRERSERNKKGLALWFYGKGVECLKQSWHNLALHVFYQGLKMDPGNTLFIYQISRVLLQYGYDQESLKGLTQERPQIYIRSEDVRLMVEETEPVLHAPKAFHLAFNQGEIYFRNHLYRKGLSLLEKAISLDRGGSSYFRKRLYEYATKAALYLNENDKAVRYLNEWEKVRQGTGPDTVLLRESLSELKKSADKENKE